MILLKTMISVTLSLHYVWIIVEMLHILYCWKRLMIWVNSSVVKLPFLLLSFSLWFLITSHLSRLGFITKRDLDFIFIYSLFLTHWCLTESLQLIKTLVLTSWILSTFAQICKWIKCSKILLVSLYHCRI